MRSGAIVPAGWAAYNGMWVAILAGFGGDAMLLWLYGGAAALTVLFGGAVVISKWRHPVDARRHPLPIRGDAGICFAFAFAFAGLGVIFGAWWLPLAFAMAVLGVWLAVKDVAARHRASG